MTNPRGGWAWVLPIGDKERSLAWSTVEGCLALIGKSVGQPEDWL
jgi:hypothetical protein